MSYKKQEWYAKRNAIDFNRPIFTLGDAGTLEILLPVQTANDTEDDTYTIIGYDWFNLTAGCWNSSYCWATPELAIKDRANVFNGSIDATRD